MSGYQSSSCLTWLGITNDLSKGKLLFFIPEKRITSIQIAINNVAYYSLYYCQKFGTLRWKNHLYKYVTGDIVNLKSRFLYEVIDNRSSWDAKMNLLNFTKAQKKLSSGRKVY